MNFIVKEYALRSDRIRSPLSIVLLGDLHGREHGTQNEELLAAVEGCRPDLIFCVGDMVNDNPASPLDRTISFMRFLPGIAPVYAVNGNHETRMRLHPQFHRNAYERFVRSLKEAGVNVLNNRSEGIRIRDNHLKIYGLEIGLEKYLKFTTPQLTLGEVDDLIGKCDENLYTILLSHDPLFEKTYFAWGASLTLSGHFHGGAIRLPNGKPLLSPYGKFMPKYGYGCYTNHENTMIVTSGLGEHSIPFRINNPMETVHIILEPICH